MVPSYNEEKGIGIVIDSVPKQILERLGYEVEIIIIDNNCTDKTAEIAISKGAQVIKESKQGKGYAILTGFRNIPDDTDIVVMVDGDSSYDAKEIPRLIEPLISNFCDVIVGTRLNGKITTASMSTLNRFGNWFFTFLARVWYKTNVTDVCSGFFAWKKYVIDNIVDYLESDGFSIEMEMIAKMAKMNYACYSVPILYTERNGKSNLRPIKDGFEILHAWLRNINWQPTKSDKKALVIDELDSVKEYS